MQKIQDQYSDLHVSRQRKWAMRNPEEAKKRLHQWRLKQQRKKREDAPATPQPNKEDKT